MTVANGLAVRRALETAGVEFIAENGGLRSRTPGPPITARGSSRSRGRNAYGDDID
jgi:hypothetical protein